MTLYRSTWMQRVMLIVYVVFPNPSFLYTENGTVIGFLPLFLNTSARDDKYGRSKLAPLYVRITGYPSIILNASRIMLISLSYVTSSNPSPSGLPPLASPSARTLSMSSPLNDIAVIGLVPESTIFSIDWPRSTAISMSIATLLMCGIGWLNIRAHSSKYCLNSPDFLIQARIVSRQ